MRRIGIGSLALLICLAGVAGCGLLTEEQLEQLDEFFQILEGPVKEPLTGQNAFVYLEQDKSRLPEKDSAALMAALKSADNSKGVADPGYEAVDLLQGTMRARQAIRADRFKLAPPEAFPPAPEESAPPVRLALDLSKLQSEYLIPHLEAIPVRNQGERGTCAAFAAIGHIEHAVLKKLPGLGSVDLSEQRFYYNSKPECHSSGCTMWDEGSWYGDGMEASVAAASFDIPREEECPYNDRVGSNDVQIPQPASCATGAVKLVKLKYVTDPVEIVAALEKDGLPVPYASALSDNWRYTDGLITQAGSTSGTQDKHSGGHAYMIVGYRKLPNHPQEGGMCFVIKNSWGTGWGVDGYSCMTLAWMEEWGKNYLDHPVVMEVLVNEDLISAPDDAPQPLPDHFVPEVYDDETVDWDDYDDGDEKVIPEPEPEPEPLPVAWQETTLVGPDGLHYRAELWQETGSKKLKLRGYIRNNGVPTGTLTLSVEDGKALYFDGDHVGDLKADHVILCTGPYDVLCSLRLNKKENTLYVEFVNPEFRRVKPEEVAKGSWESILGADDEGGFGLEFFNGDDLGQRLAQRFVLIRLSDSKGNKTDAMRLSLNGFEVRLMGEPIGSIEPGKMALCSDDYEPNCRLYRGREGVTIMPRARPK